MVPRFDNRTAQRRGLLTLVAGLGLLLPACARDGQFTVLGYTTQPNYNTDVRTVRVPIFKNYTFRRRLEFDLTKEVVRQIEQKTPYKVVGAGCAADTELLGTITIANKSIINRNQLNEVREAETLLAVELVWRDLRTGEILSLPKSGPGAPPVNLAIPAQPAPVIAPGVDLQAPVVGPAPPPGALPVPPPGVVPGPPPPPPVVVVQSLATFIPELGESITTSYHENVERLATQIVAMMEAPW